uniref:Dehydrogenase/reductase SDR family member 4 n=1 Tax=Cairina moschata TaxID=8855 RepID=A0A8C3BI24_CAIMO
MGHPTDLWGPYIYGAPMALWVTGGTPRPYRAPQSPMGHPKALWGTPLICGAPHGSVGQALDTYGGVDILVSNAAVNPVMGSTLDAEEEAWEKIFQVNVTAAAMLVKLVVPHMERRGGGAIVLVSSLAGYMPFPALGPYSVSKAALLGLLKALAPELRPRGVRINAVAPGLVRTRFSAALWEDEQRCQAVMSSMGIDRLGTPSDVAAVVTFLCSPAASYVLLPLRLLAPPPVGYSPIEALRAAPSTSVTPPPF